MSNRQHRLATLVVVAAAAAAFVAPTSSSTVGHAAGTPVTSAPLSAFRPADLPPVCPEQTVVASADTWINEKVADRNTNYGTNLTLNVTAKNNNNDRTLLQFPLPVTPTGCTLTTATLRVYNEAAGAGRTISVYRAATTWTESVVTWVTAPAPTGTAVNATAATGWMQWGVTAHVQSLYAGPNHGFILRDAVEGGATTFTQSFSSRDKANAPELVLLWG